jgi:exo-beta-1,3-glucanase (GH17 family)
MKKSYRIFLSLTITFIFSFIGASFGVNASSSASPTAAEILGNPDYPAFSYGGYRDKTRDTVPSIADIKDDMKILSALGIKIVRTYNTSQYAKAERLLIAIRELKENDPNFEMYVMLGAWIESHRAWTDKVNHHKENKKNNRQEINKAIELANNYPDIVKVIAVGNEAMVQWAAQYFVYPKTILKWVKHLQKLKASGELPAELWITSSDNYESWGGGNSHYHTDDLVNLIKAVDFVSVHTYPFHDSYYNPEYWGVLADEENLSKTAQIEAAMLRAKDYAIKQYQGAADYIHSIDPSKPIHIGETGWASIDSSEYGPSGAKAADEYKEKLYYQHMRDWTNAMGMSCFYFEAFDEQWKDSGNATGSENHFGLISLANEAKYALWDAVDAGAFDGLTRNGKAITKSYGGDQLALMRDVKRPPYKSQMPLRNITTVNPQAKAGEAITANAYVIVHDRLVPSPDNGMTYPSNTLKINPWEGTCKIEMTPQGVIEVTTGTGDWWGSSLEIQGGQGENLTAFTEGFLRFDIKGDADLKFTIGFQTGDFLAGTQVNTGTAFGAKKKLTDEWKTYTFPVSLATQTGANLKDVTGLLYLHGVSPKQQKQVFVKNIYYIRPE